LGDQQRERFGIARNRERPGVDRIEADVADQSGGQFVRAPIVTAIDDARPRGFAARLVNVKQNFARHGVEGGDDAGSRQPLGKLFRPRRCAADDELGILLIHWQGAGDDDLAIKIAGVPEYIVQPRPIYRKKESVGILRGIGRRAGAGVLCRLARQPLKLFLIAGVAENHVVAGASEQRAQLAAHQARAENADPHAAALSFDRALRAKLHHTAGNRSMSLSSVIG
jgi:hypothetical protein